ncbi:pentatricopeptide repeat-containing protein At5g15300 [Magnolia sinica]|uniref:pentatricopeptide repeat-containing protein At5g15300 n=1 Tax=Magnolia sinica TaxID=86752 RepID=UPI002658B29E|nr:pentatricopeptide repeat-containing protein At5g15300 [Magnolia sinica]
MIRKSQKRRQGLSSTLTCLFLPWHRCSTIRSLKQIHAFMVVSGFNAHLPSLRELIFSSAISVSGAIDYAHQLFDQIFEPDIFIWNTIMRGSAQSSYPSKAISLYMRMDRSGLRPDNFTFPFLLKACTKLSCISTGNQIHSKIVKFGFEADTFVRNSLINLHANCGDLDVARRLFEASGKRDPAAWSSLTAGYARRGELGTARRLFDEMPVKDLVSWNVMISVYAKNGQMESARKLFDLVPDKDIVSWNAMIAGYVLCGSHEQALEMFEDMRRAGEQPDEVTLLSLLSTCADSGALDIGRKIHHSILERGWRDMSIVLGNALIDMYAKCGSIGGAVEVFRGMRDKDVSTWNSVIGGLAFHGHLKESIHLFKEMRREKVRPNEITFVGVLVACSHGGMVDEGHRYFHLMTCEYGIEPNIKHYGCMVDILGRAGLLNEAFEFVEAMRIEPNAIIWRTLLGACRVHGNVELGEIANKRLLEMRPDQSGDYVLLSNIYASMGEWGGVEKVRKLMDDRGVRKEAGCSVIEEDNKELMHFLLDSKPNTNAGINIVIS